MVGHVRHEVRIGAVGLFHHAVFVVAVLCRTQPQRAILLIGLAGFFQRIDRSLNLAFAVQRSFKIIVVELDAEGLQIDILLIAQIGNAEFADGFKVFDIAAGDSRFAIAGRYGFLREEILRDFSDIVAVIRRLRPAGVTGLESARPRLHRRRQCGNLHPGIVVIKFTGNVIALCVQQCRQGIAQRALAAVAHMQRTSRIGRHELDNDFLPCSLVAFAELPALLQNGFDHGLFRSSGNTDIDKAGAGDFRAGDQAGGACLQRTHDSLRQFARIFLQRFGNLHRNIAGNVAMRRIARTFQRDVRRQAAVCQQGRDSGLDQLENFLFLLS